MKIFIVYKSHDPGHSEQRLREKTDLTFSELALSFGVNDLSVNSVGTIVDLYIV